MRSAADPVYAGAGLGAGAGAADSPDIGSNAPSDRACGHRHKGYRTKRHKHSHRRSKRRHRGRAGVKRGGGESARAPTTGALPKVSMNSYRNIWASVDSKPPSRTSKSSRGQRRKRVSMLRRMSTSALMQAKQRYKHVDVPSTSTPTHRRLVVRRRSTHPLVGVQRIKSAHARLLDTGNVHMRAIRAGSIWNGRVMVPPLTSEKAAASNDDTDDYSTDSDFHTVDMDALVNSVLSQPSRTSSSASLPRLATIHVDSPRNLKGTAKRSQRSRTKKQLGQEARSLLKYPPCKLGSSVRGRSTKVTPVLPPNASRADSTTDSSVDSYTDSDDSQRAPTVHHQERSGVAGRGTAMSPEGVALPTIPGLTLPSIGSTSSVGGPSSRKKRPVPGLSFLRSLSSADKDTTCSLPDLFNGQHFRREPISTPRYQYDGGASSQSAANIVERLKAQQRRLRSQRKSLRKNAKSLGDDAGAQSTLAVAEMGSLPRVKSLKASGQTCQGHRSFKSVQQVASDSESRRPTFYR